MKKIDVRCWEYDLDKRGKIYITYPDGFGGHRLIVCLYCGEVYAIDVTRELYDEPLDKKIEDVECIGCGKKLLDTYSPYPEKFLNLSGQIDSFEKPREILPDDQSIIKSFYSIY